MGLTLIWRVTWHVYNGPLKYDTWVLTWEWALVRDTTTCSGARGKNLSIFWVYLIIRESGTVCLKKWDFVLKIVGTTLLEGPGSSKLSPESFLIG